MRLFGRSKDPFAEELRKLDRKKRSLEQEESRIRKIMLAPSAPAAPDTGNPEIRPVRGGGAVFRPEPSFETGKTDLRQTRNRLKIQNQRARNRFIGVCLLILLLALVVYRTLN